MFYILLPEIYGEVMANMKEVNITKQQACRFLVTYQGLAGKRTFAGEPGIMNYIHRVGCIQFDPLNIVGHNHELVLHSRVQGFKPEMLQRLLYENRSLIDGWDKNMSIYPTSDWPCFSRRRAAARRMLSRSDKPLDDIMPLIRKEIEQRGPLSSADLDFREKVDWFWAPTSIARAALESMYFWGELIIHHKAYTRRIYDLASRHLPAELLSAPDPNADDEEYYAWYVLRRIGSVGMLWNRAGDAWLGISGLKSSERNAAFARLLEEEKIFPVKVLGIEQQLYIKSEYRELLEEIMEGRKFSKSASILAPLDNMLWDRRLIAELFCFDYKWEVYKPADERRYGYYVLPVLYGDRFIARFEPGWDKKNNAMLIKNWWWEPGERINENIRKQLGRCFKEFMGFLEAESIIIDEKVESVNAIGWLKH